MNESAATQVRNDGGPTEMRRLASPIPIRARVMDDQSNGELGVQDYRMTDFDGWTSDAVSLVERAIAAHGGLQQWKATAAINLPFLHGSGALLQLKGLGATFPAPREYEVRPHECVTLFHGYPDEQHRGRFSHGDVRIERTDGQGPSIASANHRETLQSFSKYRRWSPLDALYFFGYALWHYHVVPFMLPRARLLLTLRHHGVPVGIDVVFPPDVITHSRRQQFYFGDEGRIVRHDYVADVVGAWARGAHFWEDYQASGGLAIARRRRVVARIGRRPLPLNVLCIQLGEPSVQNESRRA